jgi:alanine-glyoxylate transaminase/serine-glyoxylate transaminase/serine-pyruvate transaminase
MKENVERCGGIAVLVEDTWGEPVSLHKVEAAFDEHPDSAILAFVHAETSTGVRSDAADLCALAARRGALSIVDAVTSLGGIEVSVDKWGVDAMYSGTQKCLSCVPGISPVTFSDRAVHRINNRQHKVQSWFLDMQLVMGYWGGASKRAYHHTAPINNLYALHEALVMLEEEGLGAAQARHMRNHRALVAGVEAMGLTMAVAPQFRLPQLNSVLIPQGVDDAALRTALLNEFDLEIGAGLGALAGMTWRIGLMGFASNARNVVNCLSALESTLQRQGAAITTGQAFSAARAVLDVK